MNTNCGLTLEELTASAICLGDYIRVPVTPHARLGMRNSSYDLDCGPPCDIARGQTAGDHNLLGDTKAHIEIGRAILDASGISTGFRKDTSVGYVLEKSVLGMGSKNVAAPVTPERVRDAMSHS